MPILLLRSFLFNLQKYFVYFSQSWIRCGFNRGFADDLIERAEKVRARALTFVHHLNVLLFFSNYLMYFALLCYSFVYSFFASKNEWKKTIHEKTQTYKNHKITHNVLFGFFGYVNPMEIWKINKQIAFMLDAPLLVCSTQLSSTQFVAHQCIQPAIELVWCICVLLAQCSLLCNWTFAYQPTAH